MIDYIYSSKITPQLNNYLGMVFEDICMHYLKRKNKRMELPFVFEGIGRWWGNNPLKRKEEEIDILAVSQDRALFGECKWRNEPLNMGVVRSLIEKSSIFNYTEKYYYFFSKGGFCEETKRYASAMKNIYLIGPEDFEMENHRASQAN